MDPSKTAAPRNDLFDVLTVFNPSDKPFPVYYNSQLHATILPSKAVQIVKLIAGDQDNGNIKHLIDRMCRQQGKSKNDPVARQAWYSVILRDQSINSVPKLPTVEDQAIQINRNLAHQPVDVPLPSTAITPQNVDTVGQPKNPQWKFDPITGARLDEKKEGLRPDQIQVAQVEIQANPNPVVPTATAPDPGAPAPSIPQMPLPTSPIPEDNAILGGIRKTEGDEARVVGDTGVTEPVAPDAPNHPESPTKDYLIDTYAKNVLMMDVNDATTRLELEKQSVDQLKESLKYDRYA